MGESSAVKVVEFTVKITELLLQLSIGIGPGGNGDDDTIDVTTPKADLGRITSAKALATRKGEADQTLKKRALARRLVPDRNDLQEREDQQGRGWNTV